MQVKNVTFQEMNQALETVNVKYEGNIIFKRLDKMGTKVIFTLKVKNSKLKGSARSFSGRKTGGCCWHGTGGFFECLLSINPNAIIISSIVPNPITKDGGNWQDKELGNSYIGIKMMSELCECEKWDNPSLTHNTY